MASPMFLAFIIGSVLLPFFGNSGEASAVTVHELNCQTDYDCSSGEFCLQSGRVSYCSPCMDCLQYNRESKGCARSRKDCGKCLPGFTELAAHCSPRVKEHVMGHQEKNSEFHHGTHEKSHVFVLVCGLLVLVVAVGVILPCQRGAGADTREETNSQNLLARQGSTQFDLSDTVPRHLQWDPTASSVPETDPVSSTHASPTLANPSERDEDDQVVPVFGNLVAYEAGNDCDEDLEIFLSRPASPSDPLASLASDALPQGSERSHIDGPDEMVSNLSETSMDFSAVLLDGEDEAWMHFEANEGGDDAIDPQEHLPVSLQQLQGELDGDSFYISQ